MYYRRIEEEVEDGVSVEINLWSVSKFFNGFNAIVAANPNTIY